MHASATRNAILLVSLVLTVSACGNRGPLYLPPPPESAKATKDAASSTDAQKRQDGSSTPRSSP